MKYKYVAMVMGAMLTMTSVGSTAPAFASDSAVESVNDGDMDAEKTDAKEIDAKETDDEDADEIFGEVRSVEDGKMVIAVGTKTEMGAQSSEEPLELTGEEVEITVTDETVIRKMSMGGAPGQGMEKPDGEDANAEAPEKPDGEETNAEVPEKPDGEEMKAEAPGKPDGMGAQPSEEITFDEIKEGDIVSVILAEDGNAKTITVQSMEMGAGIGGPGGQASGVDSYEAANEYTLDETVSDTSLESTGTDENTALICEGAEVVFENDAISRKSSDSQGGDNSSFYGVGAAVLATDGTAYVKDSTVTTDSQGGAGLFAYGDGTIYAKDTDISTAQDTSGGIHAAGGGTLYAWDLSVETNGESSAAIRSDRGGGTMVVDGGTYTSNGVGSPAVYCTADIAINNAQLTATGSEGVCIEGLNSLHIYNSDLTGNMSDDAQNDTTWTVILYQSMSGDSEIGNSTFQMEGGSITSENGGLFYTTNTECTFTLKDVEINYNDDSEFFLQCTGNNNQRGWGKSGENGSDCHFTADCQDMKGNVIWDSISDLDFFMMNGSTLEGAFVNDETYAGEGGEGYCNVTIDEDSVWTVTGDSKIHVLSNAGTITDADGNVVTITGADGTVYVEGDSAYTITVDSYQEEADTSDATVMDDWTDHEVEKPENL